MSEVIENVIAAQVEDLQLMLGQLYQQKVMYERAVQQLSASNAEQERQLNAAREEIRELNEKIDTLSRQEVEEDSDGSA